jgi:glycosyl transferase, family 25
MNCASRELTDLCPYRVCINLDRRIEKWARMQARFSELNLGPVERFAAVDGAKVEIPATWPESPGAYGCLQSHLAVVHQARAQGRENVLIFEDDVLFDDRFHEKFRASARNLPENWDMLFFGCLHHDQPLFVATGIGKLRGSFSTFMYAVRHTVYDAFVRLNSRAKQAVDRNNTVLQRLFNCYCFIPHLAWVEDSYSDAQGVYTNHWYIKESMVLRGKDVEAMEKRTALIMPYRAGTQRGLLNLRYLGQHYGALFRVLIVEFGNRPSLVSALLPANCEYCFVEAEGNGAVVEIVRCLVAALERYGEEKDYFIFNNGKVVCPRMEMRANLLKCLEYDMVSSFENYIDLNMTDSNRLINGLDLTTEGYVHRPRHTRYGEYFTGTRHAFCTLVDRLPSGDWMEGNTGDLRIFDSPGCALCLRSG